MPALSLLMVTPDAGTLRRAAFGFSNIVHMWSVTGSTHDIGNGVHAAGVARQLR